MGHINAVRLQSQTVPIVPLVQSVLRKQKYIFEILKWDIDITRSETN